MCGDLLPFVFCLLPWSLSLSNLPLSYLIFLGSLSLSDVISSSVLSLVIAFVFVFVFVFVMLKTAIPMMVKSGAAIIDERSAVVAGAEGSNDPKNMTYWQVCLV